MTQFVALSVEKFCLVTRLNGFDIVNWFQSFLASVPTTSSSNSPSPLPRARRTTSVAKSLSHEEHACSPTGHRRASSPLLSERDKVPLKTWQDLLQEDEKLFNGEQNRYRFSHAFMRSEPVAILLTAKVWESCGPRKPVAN